jgi:DNA invertase Pin-like site-specific DNA recombinase
MYEGLKIIELVRVSTAGQAKEDRAGIPRQLEDNKRTIERYRLQVAHEPLIINDVSGASVTRCPEIRDILIPLLRSKTIGGIVTSDMDRLIRPDNFDDYALLQRFKENGIIIFTSDNAIDLNTRTGFLVGGMKATIAGDDLSNIKKKMQDGKEQRRLAGKHPNSHIALPKGIGYDREKDCFILTPDIENVRQIYRLYVEDGWTHNALGKKYGLSGRGVAVLMANPIYSGWRVWDEKRGEKYPSVNGRQADRKKVRRRPEDVVFRRVFDQPPVPDPLFARAQTLLNQLRLDHTQRRQVYPDRFYYTGFLRCAHDGEVMYSRSGMTRGKSDYHVCKRNWYKFAGQYERCPSHYSNRVALYHSLDSLVREVLGDPRVLSGLLKQWLDGDLKRSDTAARRGQLEKECRALQEKRTRYLGLYGDNKYTRGELDALIDPLAEQIGTKQAEMARLRAEEAFFEAVSQKSLILRIVEVFRGFRFLTAAQKRKLLMTAGVSFLIDGHDVHGVRFKSQILEPASLRVHQFAIGSNNGVSQLSFPSVFEIRLRPPYSKALPPIPARKKVKLGV